MYMYIYMFVIISRRILYKVKNISDKRCRGNQNAVLCSKTFSENHAFYEIMWENLVELDWLQMII